MSMEPSDLLQAILEELRNIRQEVQQLRSELRELTSVADDRGKNFSRLSEQIPEPTAPTLSIAGEIADRPNKFTEIAPDLPGGKQEEGCNKVIQWLAVHKITVKTYKQQTAADAIFDQVATFLGERFESVRKVHDQIRKTLSTGSSFKINLSACTQEEIANSTQLCTILHEYAFLSAYRYHKPSKTISATPQRVGNVINFFSGGWFERFVFLKTTALWQSLHLDYLFLLNPQISLPSGDDFELDLFYLVNNEPVWIECKTGDYQPHIVKYSNVRKTLSIPKERSMLTILGIPDQLSSQLTNVYNVIVSNEINFVPKLAEIVNIPKLCPETVV